MSFDIGLQKNHSEPNKINKNIETIYHLNGTLKSNTSVISPVFLVKLPNENVPDFNYLTCRDFGRSYFVRDIKTVSGGFWEISCEVDVLTSFAEEIWEQKAIIRRNENEWNLYLNDGSFRCYQNPHIIAKSFPFGFDNTNPSFILAVSGDAVDE